MSIVVKQEPDPEEHTQQNFLTNIAFMLYLFMWSVETLDAVVTAELNALPDDMLAKLRRIGELIQAQGIERVREPHVKHIEASLWEIRLTGRDGIARALYVTASRKRVVIVRVFVKKTQKTPRSEIRLALERAKEVT